MKEQILETSSKERVNAAISYFFMGPMVLLATNNPVFNSVFIQEHAKRASKWLLYWAGLFIVHFIWLSRVTGLFIPIVWVRLDKTITFWIFLTYFIFTLIGAYQALQGYRAKTIIFWIKNTESEVYNLQMNESEKLRTIACYIPVISLFVSDPDSLGKLGRIISNWFTVLLLAVISLGYSEVFQMTIVTVYIIFVVSLSVFLFIDKQPTFLKTIKFLPEKEEFQAFFYTLPTYFWQAIQAILWKRIELNFLSEYNLMLQKERQFEQGMSDIFVENTSPFSPYTIYIPGVNLIHGGTFFSPKKSKNIIAVWQWIIITLLFIAAIYFYGENDSLLLVLLYASIVGISRIKERPFYKIPGIYELYWLISIITFGLVSSAGTVRNKSSEKREESIRIDEK